MKQGDSLSPLLFSIFIYDLTRIGIDQVSILLYADAIVLLVKTHKDLQTMLDYLNQWCGSWKIYINPSKSKIVHL